MTSTVDVVNIALAEIGAQAQIQSFDPSDGSEEANVASLLYQPKIDALMRAVHWNFCRRQSYLSLLKSAMTNGVASTNPPPSPWRYSYAYPSDCLKIRYLLPDLSFSSSGSLSTPLSTSDSYPPPVSAQEDIWFALGLDYDTSNNPIRVILTNTPNVQAVYTARVNDPNLWDPNFLNAATASLGAWFINALARNRALLQDQVKIATQIIAEARVTDGNEGPQAADHTPDWLRIRGMRGGTAAGGTIYQGFDTMAFPGSSSF